MRSRASRTAYRSRSSPPTSSSALPVALRFSDNSRGSARYFWNQDDAQMSAQDRFNGAFKQDADDWNTFAAPPARRIHCKSPLLPFFHPSQFVTVEHVHCPKAGSKDKPQSAAAGITGDNRANGPAGLFSTWRDKEGCHATEEQILATHEISKSPKAAEKSSIHYGTVRLSFMVSSYWIPPSLSHEATPSCRSFRPVPPQCSVSKADIDGRCAVLPERAPPRQMASPSGLDHDVVQSDVCCALT